MGFLAVMHATIYLVSEVDADLSGIWSVVGSIADHRAQLTSAYRRAGLPCPFVVVTESKPVETGSVAVEAIVYDLKRLW